MQLHAMKDLGEELLRQEILPAGTEIQVLIDQDPAVLAFVARQKQPPRAGTVLVSQEAAEDDGPAAITEALRELLARIEQGRLPEWPVMQKSPLLAVRTSQGWQLGPDS